MKLILSRKGFDSANGGVASPILPDGTLLSLPIPSDDSPILYRDLHHGDTALAKVVADLTNERHTGKDPAHLDPDLYYDIYPRQPGWRPLFGQAGAARTHLMRAMIGSGDIFLFFGWFREVKPQDGRYRFVKDAPDRHVIFGWLQVDTVLSVRHDASEAPGWSRYHPHFHETWPKDKKNNTIYVSQRRLELGGTRTNLAGGGTFKKYHRDLCLTVPGCTRSWWRLPKWFFPGQERSPLSYHRNIDRWSCSGDCVILQSVAIGQEFVLDTDEYPEAIAWINNLMTHAL